MPDAETNDDWFGRYFSTSGVELMTEMQELGGTLFHCKTYSASCATSTNPGGTYSVTVFSTADIPSP